MSAAHMSGNALIAPTNVGLELTPLQLRSLDRQTGDCGQLVVGVLKHVREALAQCLRALSENQAEFGEQSSDSIDASGALLLEAFAQPVHSKLTLLLCRLDRNDPHVR